MKAITFAGFRDVEFETVEDPRIEAPTDAIVEVAVAGICGSDLHPYHEREEGLDFGTVMGHEFVGRVAEVGADVTRVKVGDVVYCPFTTNCGECHYCSVGLTSRCTRGQLFGWVGMGEGLHGGQADGVRVPLADTTLARVGDNLTHEQALMLGDVAATGYFCAEQADIKPDGIYAVIGCGPVGIMAVRAARHLGAEMVYAIDSVSERLEMAGRAGAVPINYESEDPVLALHEAADGRGADGVMEAVGSFGSARSAIELVRPGGVVSVVGVHTETEFAFSPAEAYDKNLTYKVGRCPARAYMQRLAPFVESGDLVVDDVISHRVPLADGADAYRLFDEKRDNCTKVVLKP
ncbi:MAG: alcohol dehydrogenase catalytic domain-containing protein [Acidobacteria bacterium]|nr:alcohol dehydrogenase catalytic domain-containing protein [Acidobacteriota bacterium]